MNGFPYHALPDLTPSEQATFTRIIDQLRARRFAMIDQCAPWDRPEFFERLHPIGRRTSQVARVTAQVFAFSRGAKA